MTIRKVEPILAAVPTQEDRRALDKVLGTLWKELKSRFKAKQTHYEDTTVMAYDNLGYRGEVPVIEGLGRSGTAIRIAFFLRARGFKMYSGWFRGEFGCAMTKRTCTVMVLYGGANGASPLTVYTWVAHDERGLMINAPTSDFKLYTESPETN